MRALADAQRRAAPPQLTYLPPPTTLPPEFDKVQRLEAFRALDTPQINYDIIDYAREVELALGKFETFSVFQAGTYVIPITLDGVELQPGQHLPNGKADRPPLLGVGPGTNAKPYARVGRLQALRADGTPNPDVDWVFISRRYQIRTDPNYPKFEDVAVIGHNRVTGAAAFFQMLEPSNPKDGRVVPSPMDTAPAVQAQARAFWLTPQDSAGIACYACHTGDVWIHSPYIDQVTVTNAQGIAEPIVPRGSNLASVPKYNPPYNFVGSQAFNQWPSPKQLKPPGNLCVTCHRIGSENRLSFISYATGRATPSSQSASFSTFPKSHWMPPGLESDMTEADYNAMYKSSIDQLLSFLADPNQPGATPLPIP